MVGIALRKLLILLGVVALSGCFDSSDNADPTLRVMTYNIHNGRGEDKILDLDRLGNIIESQMPDLVALQEVNYKTTRSLGIDQAEALAIASNMPYFIFGRAKVADGGGEYGVAILSRYPFELSGNEALPISGGNEPRTALWAVVRIPGIGEVLFISTHLEAYYFDDDRMNQIQKLIDVFGSSPITPAGTAMPDNVVIAGDLNAGNSSAELALLELAGFQDAFVGEHPATFPSPTPTDVYDWVLLPETSALKPFQSWVLDEPIASDHLPVVVDLQ
jgi:endonuclease/exonuclease/phosphatase family metal-dependent hydrolase